MLKKTGFAPTADLTFYQRYQHQMSLLIKIYHAVSEFPPISSPSVRPS